MFILDFRYFVRDFFVVPSPVKKCEDSLAMDKQCSSLSMYQYGWGVELSLLGLAVTDERALWVGLGQNERPKGETFYLQSWRITLYPGEITSIMHFGRSCIWE